MLISLEAFSSFSISKGCYQQAQTRLPLDATRQTYNQLEQQNVWHSTEQLTKSYKQKFWV